MYIVSSPFIFHRLAPFAWSLSFFIQNGGRRTVGQAKVESLSNEDGNVNENVAKQWIKLQNTITARGNATTWPLFRHRLWKQNVKTSILVFCRERERKSTNHFNLHAALKTKLLNFHIHTPSGLTKKKRISYTNKKTENGKFKIQQPSSMMFPS